MISLRTFSRHSGVSAAPRATESPLMMTPESPNLDASKDYCTATTSLNQDAYEVTIFNAQGIQAAYSGLMQADFEMFVHSGGWIINAQRYDYARGGRVIQMSRRKEV